MHETDPRLEFNAVLQDVLGHLNFSSGARDPKFLRNLSELMRSIWAGEHRNQEPADVLYRSLAARLEALHGQGSAFADIEQARSVLALVFEKLLPEYRRFHTNQLFHQTDRDLWQPFLLGVVFETVLSLGPPWDETERLVADSLTRLNDYLGYRPVAVLETQKIEPYEHEWLRPIPLYISGAGVAAGRYAAVMERTWEILLATSPQLLARAWFDPAVVEELALDPRAYDFDHPVNKRPNYHFGQWDPHRIDNQGRYRRFIIQQVALDALLSRLDETSGVPADELLLEAATVLAGTILMASGTSGSGPDTHDSTTTLSKLIPRIVTYRDEFYAQALAQLEGPLGQRLKDESAKLHQPFGGARQHLNQKLARLRATQLQHVRLAQLFARMGYPEAAMREAQTVRVASARMLCEMYCRLTLGHRAIDAHALEKVADYLAQIEQLLHDAVECGAVVDPWNIVGFGGNFSLFPAVENSVRDYRVDTLIELVEQIFALCARAWSEAAAQDDAALERRFSQQFAKLGSWWDQFATPTVASVKRLVGKELEISTNLVAGALNAWHKAGAEAGDVGFWRMFVDQFDSPKAFQLVVEALMEKGDLVASMALLMQWLSQAPRIPLKEGDSSFHRLALRWMRDLEQSASGPEAAQRSPIDPWPVVCKFFDYLEANAEELWRIPRFELAGAAGEKDQETRARDGDEPGEEDDHLFSAAYENMTYRDSTDDGVEGETLESGSPATDLELEQESKRLKARLALSATLARLWKFAACTWGTGAETHDEEFYRWQRQAAANHAALLRLLGEVHHYRLRATSGDHDSLVEYDRRRTIKEGLLERIVATAVETADAERFLSATGARGPQEQPPDEEVRLWRAVLAGDAQRVRDVWPDFLKALRCRSILYVPISRGGDPAQIVAARATQQTLRDLLAWLPRLGLLRETCTLLETAQLMESEHPLGPGAVTEFDRLFETGYKAVVESIVASAETWDRPTPRGKRHGRASDNQLVECVQQLTESQLKRWLRHSRTLRLSVVENLAEERQWQSFVQFVKHHGRDLFTQKFLNLGNVRAILHQGVDTWLAQLEENPDAHEDLAFVEDLCQNAPRADAVKHLKLALEAIVENYAEYRDYNSTTTQSDCGELLYTLVDFLRLRAEYDRVAWNLKPVVIAHEILVRRGRSEAAEMWRRALAQRTRDAADRHVQRLADLSQTYGMRLPTIASRIAERFVRPLAVDRVRALVRPAMDQAYSNDGETTFSLLSQEIQELADEPTGAGFDLPAWLVALEEEVAGGRSRQLERTQTEEMHQRIPHVRLSLEQVQAELDALTSDDSP